MKAAQHAMPFASQPRHHRLKYRQPPKDNNTWGRLRAGHADAAETRILVIDTVGCLAQDRLSVGDHDTILDAWSPVASSYHVQGSRLSLTESFTDISLCAVVLIGHCAEGEEVVIQRGLVDAIELRDGNSSLRFC